MDSNQLKILLKQLLADSHVKFDPFLFDEVNKNYQIESFNHVTSFCNRLTELASSQHYILSLHHLNAEEFLKEINELNHPIVVFEQNATLLKPYILTHTTEGLIHLKSSNGEIRTCAHAELLKLISNISYLKSNNQLGDGFLLNRSPETDILFLSGYPAPTLLKPESTIHSSPMERIFGLLKEEKKDISYIYFYAIMMGLVSLSLPLGIQAIIGLISGGLFLNSVIVLMALVVGATVVSGWIQVLQLSVVEVLQQRIFAKAAIEFTYRIPRLKIESLGNRYAPEVMNRFFDILTIQKSLPKILIDVSTAGVQIIFGLILLAFYHPIFIVLGLFISLFIVAVFYFTGKKAIETDINSSKYKYKVAYWLEEMARALTTFKLAGNTPLPIQKMDMLVSHYLKYRQNHFTILVKQFKAIIAFKTFITAGLLILGGVLVVERQINLGQFVAAEVIILLVISSVEKLISILDSIYDVITAADKIGDVIDFELEPVTGINPTDLNIQQEFNIEIKNLSYTFPQASKPVINKLNLKINHGDKICVTGYNDSGKSTLIKLVSGLLQNYEGQILLNGHSLKLINLSAYRALIADNLSEQEIFEGTIEENITLNLPGITLQQIDAAVEKSGLKNYLQSLEKGMFTKLEAGGAFLSKSNKQKLILARSFASKPKLMVIDEFFYNAEKTGKDWLIKHVIKNQPDMSVLIISNDKNIMEQCDYVAVLHEGAIVAQGDYNTLLNSGKLELF